MNLYDDLSKISKQVKTQLQQMKNNEAATINVSVQPVIRALGYDMENLSEVYPEYPILNMDAVDYAIMRDGKPKIFIEAKNANVALDKHWKQLFQYFNADDVIVGILTNGIEYRFYTDLKKRHIMDKQPFMTLDMLNLDERLVAKLESFTMAGFDPERINASAQKRVLMRILRQEIDKPSEELAKHFARQVHSGRLSNSDIQRYARLVKEAWHELVEQEWQSMLSLPARITEPPPVVSSEPKAERTYIDLPVLDGAVSIPIYATWEGHEFTATLSLWGKIANVGNIVYWDGEWMTPLQAGKRARMTVDPSATHYVNGMTFWNLRDPADRRLRPINDFHYDQDLLPRVLENAAK